MRFPLTIIYDFTTNASAKGSSVTEIRCHKDMMRKIRGLCGKIGPNPAGQSKIEREAKVPEEVENRRQEFLSLIELATCGKFARGNYEWGNAFRNCTVYSLIDIMA